MIYIGCFLLSVLFTHYACRLDYKHNRYLFLFIALLGILIPSVLGGLRNYSIGTDVLKYVISDYNAVKYSKNGLIGYLTYGPGREKLYLTLAYVVAKLTGGGNWNQGSYFLFVIQFVIMACIFYGAYKQRDNVSAGLVMLLFFLLHYNATYNLVRQYLGCAIVFAGLHNLTDKHYKKFAIIVVIAAMFHMSLIMGMILIPIHWLSMNYMKKQSSIREIELILGIMIGTQLLPKICMWLINVGILKSKYAAYFIRDSLSNSNFLTLLYVIELVVIFVISQNNNNKIVNFNFYKTNLITLFAILQVGKVIWYGERFSILFSMVNLITIAAIPKFFKKGKSRIIVTSAIILLFLFYWWYVYVNAGSGETYPYKSIFS